MDKHEKRGLSERLSLWQRMRESIGVEIEKRKKSREQPVADIGVFAAALLLGRCGIMFGAHPLGIALICVLPSRVWIAAIGAAVGSFTLGAAGLIYAMISVIAVLLRVIISTTGHESGERAFGESLLLRMSVAVICGFICALYEVLLSGVTMAAVLFGGTMVIACPVVTFGLSGLVGSGVDVYELIYGSGAVFSIRGRPEREKYGIIFFQCSALLLLFLLGLSLGSFELFGISAAYIFAGVVMLLCARRLGSLRAAAVGFVTMLGLSSAYSVAYALLGLVGGVLFRIGVGYAVVGGGAALLSWCAYAGGLVGFLSVLPEYLISAITVSPIVGRLHPEKTDEESAADKDEASEMAGTVALAYRNKYSGALDSLEVGLGALGRTVDSFAKAARTPTEDDMCELVVECIDKYCSSCTDGCSGDIREACSGCRAAFEKNMHSIAAVLAGGGAICREDICADGGLCSNADGLCETINRAVGIYGEQMYLESRGAGLAEQMSSVGALLAQARHADEEEKSFNAAMSATVKDVVSRFGLADSAVKVLGKRRPHIIIAAEDSEGDIISSEELRARISEATGLRLSRPDFYRRERMAVMECSAAVRLACDHGHASLTVESEKICGDAVLGIETADGMAHMLLSDGMGSGAEARRASDFVCELVGGALGFGMRGEDLISLANRVLMSGGRECSASLDMCSVDLFCGECTFLKSGAATSYIKRDSSIFRISSRTAPLGLMKRADGERIRASVAVGDMIIMLSDGVCGGAEDAPWLLELLTRPSRLGAKEYAELILRTAAGHTRRDDDMTVAVVRVCEAADKH